MKNKILSLLLLATAIAFLICGCKGIDNELMIESETSENVSESISFEYGEVLEDFYFIIQDVFISVDQETVIVVGTNKNSPMYSGMEVAIVTSDDIKKASIGPIEIYEEGLVDGVPVGCNVGLQLVGVSKDDVHAGDVLVLPEIVEHLEESSS